MSHIDDDLLVDLALGEPTDETTAGHLASCATCRAGLDALVRTVAVTRAADAEVLVPAPPSVWASIEAVLDADEPPAPSGMPPTGAAGEGPTPPASVTPIDGGRRSRIRRVVAPGWLVVAAAVAGIALGSAGTALVTSRTEPAPAPSPAVVAAAHLDTLTTGVDLGNAEVLRSSTAYSLTVTAHDLHADGGYLEVWLLNRDGKRMVSVGILPGNGTRTFPIAQSLINQGYVVVDISREAFDTNPAHSGDSLVRGTLKA